MLAKKPWTALIEVAVKKSGTPGRRIAGLDLLRLAAAVSVMIFHLGFRGAAGQNLSPVGYPEIAGLAKYGFYGVDLFFMISGFVIAVSAEGRGAMPFALARAKRLYPGFVVCMTLTALIIALWGVGPHHVTLKQWVANLTIAPQVFGQKFVDGAYWSILLEIIFYGWVWVFLAFGLFERRMLEIVGAWLAICLVNETVLQSKPLQWLAITEYGPLFASGILIYRLWRGDQRPVVWGLLAAAATLTFYHAFEVQHDFGQLYKEPMPLATLWTIQLSLYAVFVAALWASRSIAATPLVLAIGGLTYPLYLLHQNAGYIGLARLEPVIGKWPALLVVIAAIFAAAYAVWRFAEPAGRAWMTTAFERTGVAKWA
jgi:peptidoglycan/LPS O-acetylase OafA/YrhL